MKTILVTGLDGSGKSTFFSKLSAAKRDGVALLFVPHIDMSRIEPGTPLYATADFVNYLSAEADKLHEPRLKALSVFAAMLLFRELSANLVDSSTDYLFCERHPLIDSSVYAKFYAERMNPKQFPQQLLGELDVQFEHELDYLLQLLPGDIVFSEKTRSGKLGELIYQWFHVDGKNSNADLQKLFSVGLPDEIYFLSAPAEILFERIRKRERREPHESLDGLTRLSDAYSLLMQRADKDGSCKVTIVNAENFNSLDHFAEQTLQLLNA